MARLPLVAIVGRPNTGKSTLFNRMAGGRIAIESSVSGTTRDHVLHHVTGEKVDYLLADTGGIGGGTTDKDFEKDVQAQSILAIEAADVIIMTVNSREELTKGDREAINLLRKRKRNHVPVLLAMTKVDNFKKEDEAVSVGLSLGLSDDVFAVSAPHGLGIDELDEAVEKKLLSLHFAKAEARSQDGTPRIAIVGKPNVGKSSLVNALMNEEQRQTSPRIVSDIPGTTRDSADTIIRHEGMSFTFVDTAGLKRQSRTEKGIEGYAMLRSLQAIDDCDVALLLLDGTEQISKQDKRIADQVIESGKGLCIVVNKADKLDAEKKKEKLQEIRMNFQFCKYAQVLFVSAKTKEGILKTFVHLQNAAQNRVRRVPLKELHRWLTDAVHGQPMHALHSAKHIVQAEDAPPTFVIFVRDPKKVQLSQLRFLENRIRELYSFEGTPIKWITKMGSGKPREERKRKIEGSNPRRVWKKERKVK